MKKSLLYTLAVLLVFVTALTGCAAVASMGGAHYALAVVMSVITVVLASVFCGEMGDLRRHSA